MFAKIDRDASKSQPQVRARLLLRSLRRRSTLSGETAAMVPSASAPVQISDFLLVPGLEYSCRPRVLLSLMPVQLSDRESTRGGHRRFDIPILRIPAAGTTGRELIRGKSMSRSGLRACNVARCRGVCLHSLEGRRSCRPIFAHRARFGAIALAWGWGGNRDRLGASSRCRGPLILTFAHEPGQTGYEC